MPRLPALSVAALISLAAALSACTPEKPADAPEATAEPAAKDKDKGEADAPKEGSDGNDGKAEPAPTGDSTGGGQAEAPKPKTPPVDPSLSLDTYEMTPADCNDLGRHYGEVQRSDQVVALPPKLSAKQRAATIAQIDKVVGKLEESWTSGCHASLVDKAVDQNAIKCALAAKTVKEFDVCLNGPGGTPQPAGKPSRRRKR